MWSRGHVVTWRARGGTCSTTCSRLNGLTRTPPLRTCEQPTNSERTTMPVDVMLVSRIDALVSTYLRGEEGGE
eukprot:5630270-Prymnesium_polylepis.1